jgi:hypothetical protein
MVKVGESLVGSRWTGGDKPLPYKSNIDHLGGEDEKET